MASSTTATAVRVMARFRPLNTQERSTDRCVRHHLNNNSVVTSISETGESPYTFDHVFVNATQEEVYVTAAQPITNAVLQGYNGTIFAYGQTSSGKTYTMTGNPDDLYDDKVRGTVCKLKVIYG